MSDSSSKAFSAKPPKPLTAEEKEELQSSLKRCPPGTFEDVVHYRESGDPTKVKAIVLGIIHRFLEPEYRPLLDDPKDELHFIDDLRVDSLTMMEIVILTEETLGIGLDNNRLKEIQNLGDLQKFIDGSLS